jgi:hypothetical protein
MFLGVQKSVREWTLTLPSDSHFGSWSANGLPNVQKAIAGAKTHWIEESFISLKKSWNVDVWNGLHDLFGQLKHRLWPKEGLRVKLAIWLPTTKSQESPNFLMWRWCATYLWKDLDKGYKFALDLISIRGLHTKLWAPKVGTKIEGVPTLGISRFPLGSLKTKCHLDANLVAMHIIYYKEEGGDFPQVWTVMNFMSSSLPVARFSTKSVPVMH